MPSLVPIWVYLKSESAFLDVESWASFYRVEKKLRIVGYNKLNMISKFDSAQKTTVQLLSDSTGSLIIDMFETYLILYCG